MKKHTHNFIIGLAIASIIAALFGTYRSGDWMDALSGTVIGIALIGVAIIEKKKNQEE